MVTRPLRALRAAFSGNEPRQRFDGARARKDLVTQNSSGDAKLFAQNALENGAQIRRRLEVALFVELLVFEAWPVGNHAAAFNCASGQKRDRARTVIGARCAVDAGGAAEFSDHDDRGILPA